LGSLRSADGKGVVRIEDQYDTDAEDLWSALTDPSRLARWYGEVDGDLRPGGEFRVYLEGAGLYGAGRIEVCERPVRLHVVTTETDESWRPGDGPLVFDESIEAVLKSDGETTNLVIEARGMPVDKIAFYGAGWQIHAEHLARYLAGQEVADGDAARWDDLVPDYQELAANLG
jgi:uncharacterized protein YndB with AHSA1/START domain